VTNGAPVARDRGPGEAQQAAAPGWRPAAWQAAPRLRPRQPIAPQLAQATVAWSPGAHAAVRAQVTAVPGEAARRIRTVMYQLMNLPEPAAAPNAHPVPVPEPVRVPGGFGEAR